ncbi:NADH:flavin oxidoreductase/NADH oxidase [Streptococcus oricebi]|uniref:NADPH dehydrogenase n=1 Tax=Streptococcus oricebi TaxID=1547447 RepID=A0ABS5B2T6_9STRE|nr:NADH:flavin oxidoreductase/NADH oxidase [Streptococcus oricebi]MBP2623122.1 NADPH dehydrogenase [Streptococcus oricebi]
MKTKLFAPLSLGSLELKNRVAMAPMCMYEVKAEDGRVTEFHKIHYGARALGGVGLITIEANAIDPNGRLSAYDLGLWNNEQAEALASLIQTLHHFGSKVGIQINHAGRKATASQDLIAPSALAYSAEYGEPRAMTTADIDELVLKFQHTAQLAAKARVDMIEIHAAHGYLLNQFISNLTNQRKDEYGGSLENRYRLLGRVVEAVQQVFQGALWVRISADEYHEEGTKLEEFIQLAKWLKADGVEVVHVSSGGLIEVKPSKIYPGYQVPLAKAIKEGANVAVSAVGLLNDPKLVDYLLQTEAADIISLGRPLLANPNWLQMAAKELRAEDELKLYNASYERGRVI